jgi:beta-glucosidase
LSTKPAVTNHYELYKEDLVLLRNLGVNAYRFSLEWSRIQPRENIWDEKAIEHYQEVVTILRSYNIEPMVTLHHFTHPLWFIKKYPWHTDAAADKFLCYVEKVLSTVKGVRYWITFNEPYVLVLAGYFEGCTPPAIRNVSLGLTALTNILGAHGRAYDGRDGTRWINSLRESQSIFTIIHFSMPSIPACSGSTSRFRESRRSLFP